MAAACYCPDPWRGPPGGWEQLLSLAPEGSQLGLVVEPITSGPVTIDYRSQALMPPASTLKLLTAYAAERELGPDFRFHTRLLRRGNRTGSQWSGDLRLEFSGAPDFSRSQLRQLLERLGAEGIDTINGNLLLDTSAYDGYAWAEGWPWNNLSVCYSAPVPALILDENCVAASLTARAPGDLARFYIPPHQPLLVENEATTVTPAQQRRQLCELEVDTGPGNRYRLHGCVVSNRKVWPLNFAVTDPVAFASDVIRLQLQELGIRLNGQIREERSPGDGWQEVARISSAPLSQLLGQMLQVSDNLVADSLLKTLGRHQTGTAGNFRNGARALKARLQSDLGLLLDPAVIADGSGLSRDNLLQPAQLAQLLRHLAGQRQAITYRSLAVAGESGTLRYRRSLSNSVLLGNLRGKSGTINATTNLAGYLTARSGREYLFVVMVSGISLNAEDRQQARRDSLKHPVRAFERSLLEWVYHNG
ncbi:serine-type D-Ala-D-Ala carboxypeptidase [Marinobacterium nitratireducens]|uniref:Serine-type D-Ala-D-Ala carboxypeptidase n=1 Tax=Marinobacterium nitratireducens TaxID=518897 RepID=A0A917ZP80_9GAMM|nr:D-alanyl-D-alanine carboxypeptidase/D-alanyl-D-alanine-endopeptidase [Marinobacterium nitratireducens]GGO86901.1 serine-type D-Ala-D-Ala carboxypeptidase [Marinobacterium nitratireducens]